MTVRVVTDSTADLPPALLKELSITVVPLMVLFGEQSYRDGIDLTTDEFFQKLVEDANFPTTSQPSVGALREVYERLARDADGIVSVHIGANFSGTVAAATMARDSLDTPCRIEVVDSEATSLGLGFAAVAAARAAKAGATLEEVAAAAKSIVPRQHLLVYLDTLEYARRGGRISRIEALVGSLLSLKAIISIHGEVTGVARMRTRAAGLKKLFELALSYPNIEEVGIMHATTPQDADLLAAWVRERLPGVPVSIVRLGSTLGTHGGPGVMAMTVVEGEKTEA